MYEIITVNGRHYISNAKIGKFNLMTGEDFLTTDDMVKYKQEVYKDELVVVLGTPINEKVHNREIEFRREVSMGSIYTDGCTKFTKIPHISEDGMVGYSKELNIIHIIDEFRHVNNAMFGEFFKLITEHVDNYKDTSAEEYEAVIKAKELEKVVNIIREQLFESEEELLREVNHLHISLDDINTQQERIITRITGTNKKLEELRSGKNNDEEELIKIIGDIYKNKKVRAITNSNRGVMRVKTEDLICRPTSKSANGRTYEEAYKIPSVWLDIDFERADVYINGPEDNKREGFWGPQSHPHANTAGRVCWGSAKNTVKDLIRSKDLVLLIDFLIAFCESANVDDGAGARIYNWDVVKEEVEEINIDGSKCDACGIILPPDEIVEVEGIFLCETCKRGMSE